MSLISDANPTVEMKGGNYMKSGVILQSFNDFQALGNEDYVVLFFTGATDSNGLLDVNLRGQVKYGATVGYLILQQKLVPVPTVAGHVGNGVVSIDANALSVASATVTVAVFVKSCDRATSVDN